MTCGIVPVRIVTRNTRHRDDGRNNVEFTVNGKNLEVGRFMVRGKDADSRLKFLHFSKDGVTAFNPHGIMRVSMPAGVAQPSMPVIVPQGEVDKWSLKAEAQMNIPEDVCEPGVTSPDYLVPNVKSIIPDPETQEFSVTVNGEMLLKMLKAACAVCEDSEKTLKLRYFPKEGKVRIDTYAMPGQQQFLGVLMELDYPGTYVPGDKTGNGPVAIEKPAVQKELALLTEEGRKFR
jgi:hypothetical protein